MKKCLLLSFVFVFSMVWAQDRIVTGKITSAEDGSPLPGVNVVLKGTSSGTVTDVDGNYKVTVPASDGTLAFSFIGLQTQEIEVGAQSTIDVRMSTDVKQLTEVVVTAQGIQTEKRALGYAVSSVGGDVIAQKPESDVSRLLQGKVPGVNITASSGISGAGTKINIRGFSSISGSTQPLFVVDGVPFNTNTNSQNNFADGNQGTTSRFLDLDPNNIENIEVLKGLSATVLYGEQGRNGVILVTTKGGSAAGKKKDFEISVFQSVFANKIATMPDYQNSYGIGNQNQYGLNFGNWGPSFSSLSTVPHPYAANAAFPEFAGTTVDYKPYKSAENFFRTGTVSTTSINLGASKENLSYNATFSYVNEDGFTPANNLRKINGGVGINSKLTKKLTLGSTFNFAQTDQKSPPVAAGYGSGVSGGGSSVFADIFYTPRSIDLLNLPFEDPITHKSVYYRASNDIQNPLWTIKYTGTTDNVRRFYGRNSLAYQLTDDLNISYRVGLDTYTENQEYFNNKGGVQIVNGLYRTTSIVNTIWNHDVIVNYSHDFNDKLGLTVVAGANGKFEEFKQDGLESTNQLVFGFMNHSNFTTHSSSSTFGGNLQYMEKKNTVGTYGQVTLDFNRYVYLNLAGRNDWYSTLEKDNRSIFYPSASISFIPTTAFENLESDNFNYLKVRLGYGTSAKSPDPYSTRSILGSNARAFDNGTTVYSTNSVSNTLGNPLLKPELQQEYEAGIEAKFVKNRIGLDLTLFDRSTTDLITDAPLDPSTGYTSTSVNIGKLSNKGVEIGLNVIPVQTEAFKWDFFANFYKYKSVVEKLDPGIKQIQISGFSGSYGNYAIEGEQYNVIQGTYISRDANGNKIVNANGDYVVGDDIKIIGNPNPDFTLSLINNFNYKGVTLSMQWDYRQGGDIYSVTANTLYARGITKDTEGDRSRTVVLEGVSEGGEKNTAQTTYNNAMFNNYFGAGEGFIYDGTTVRLRQVSLGYSLPKSIIGNTPFKAVSIQFQGQNLWFKSIHFPKYSNFDTDQLGTGVGNGLGLDLLAGPTSRRYGASLKITF